MTGRRIATAKGATRTPDQAALRLTQAFQAVFSTEDGEIVLSELTALTGFFRPPSFTEWMKSTGGPAGYELHCALQAARCEPLRVILAHLNMSDERMIALHKAAQEARS